MNGRISKIFVVDVLAALVLMLAAVVVLSSPRLKKPVVSSVPTAGLYAVTLGWAEGSEADVDLYVRDPAGRVVYYANVNAGVMHLEHDDLGLANDQDGEIRVRGNHERVVLRGVNPGEYTVNAHLYSQPTPGTVKAMVRLWMLAGEDRMLREQQVVLSNGRRQETAFRFTATSTGAGGFNRLPANLVEDW